jgi:hypothetical protein
VVDEGGAEEARGLPYISIRQHTSAYVDEGEAEEARGLVGVGLDRFMSSLVSSSVA